MGESIDTSTTPLVDVVLFFTKISAKRFCPWVDAPYLGVEFSWLGDEEFSWLENDGDSSDGDSIGEIRRRPVVATNLARAETAAGGSATTTCLQMKVRPVVVPGVLNRA